MTLPPIKPATRRRYPPEFKQKIVNLCQPGVSIAGVALSHGLNTNLLRRWIHKQRSACPVVTPSINPVKLIPLAVTQSAPPQSDNMIEITLTGKNKTVALRWPASAASTLAPLLADWLK